MEPVYYGDLGTSQQRPDCYQGVLIFSKSVYIIMYHLGPQLLGVWIMQVSTFSRVLINRFHCYNYLSFIVIPAIFDFCVVKTVPCTV